MTVQPINVFVKKSSALPMRLPIIMGFRPGIVGRNSYCLLSKSTEGWRKHSLTFLLKEDQLCKYKGMITKELRSHRVQAKSKGCVLHTIINHYLYIIHGPYF